MCDRYVAMPIRQVPIPVVPSVERHCARCRIQVWVDYRYAGMADDLEIICWGCAEKEWESDA